MNGPILLKRHQIDDRAWNALIDEARNPVVYAYTWYLDCVSPHWQALVLIDSGELIVDSAPAVGHQSLPSFGYRIVMPLPVRRKWGVRVVQLPLFCQYLGVFSKDELTEYQLARFLGSLDRHFPYVSVYDFHPAHTNLLRKLLPSYQHFEPQDKATHWLNLEKPYAELARGFSADRRKNLKKSRKYAWEWVESEDIEPLIQLFRDNHASQIQNVQESAYDLLKNLARTLLQKQTAIIYYALQHGKIHGGTMIVEKNRMGIYIFNAADSAGRRGNARTFLLDQYFQAAAGQLKTFDFESPEVESITRFYESFGAGRQVLISIKKNKLPFPFRQLQNWRRQWLTST